MLNTNGSSVTFLFIIWETAKTVLSSSRIVTFIYPPSFTSALILNSLLSIKIDFVFISDFLWLLSWERPANPSGLKVANESEPFLQPKCK